MKEIEILEIVKEYVKKECINDVAAHDWWHIYRVYNLANEINKYEKGNEFIVIMIVLLHDVFDWKFCPDVNVSEEVIKLLEDLKVKKYINQSDLDNICHSVSNLGFNGGFEKIELSKEGQIAYDADKIDAMGAVGIARIFAYGGKVNRPIYNSEEGIIVSKSEEEYKYSDRSSISHFYEKLLKLKDFINTDTGKKIANKRHEFMREYLGKFFEEWEAKDMESKE